MESNEAGRERYWSELNVEEKVERLRAEIRALRAREEDAQRMLEEVRQHVHTQNGLPVVEKMIGEYPGLHRFGLPLGEPPLTDDVYI